MAKRVEKLADCVSREKAEVIVPEPLHGCEYLLDDELIEDLRLMDAEDAEWFDDPRIGKWMDYRNSLTKRNMDDVM